MTELNFDYIFIGAGVIGSSTAYHLKKALPGSKILLMTGITALEQGLQQKVQHFTGTFFHQEQTGC
jgi:glycine/D-amino acid oxidase-like deaminating enzyme